MTVARLRGIQTSLELLRAYLACAETCVALNDCKPCARSAAEYRQAIAEAVARELKERIEK